MLNTIRYAEGTWGTGCNEGYRTIYGGGRAESLELHPDILVVKRYASDAAGAYQCLPDTWRSGSRKAGPAQLWPRQPGSCGPASR